MDVKKRAKIITDWIDNYCNNASYKPKSLVVGISGGIDSSVVSTLCANTGRKTIVLTMPIKQIKSQHDLSLTHAKWLKQKYKNVEHHLLEMDKIFNSFSQVLNKFDNEHGYANSRARLRMATLYQVAAANNGIVVGTGNKVEDFGVGFYTKYGDGGVDISPIADCNKSQVWELGRHLGVSEEIINAQPTDGLWDDGRNDVEQLGMSYADLEKAMENKDDPNYQKYLEIREKKFTQNESDTGMYILMNSLKLTNSLTRKKEVFKPNNIKKISLYACGPTVYESPHVGNARTLVVFDVLFRVLKVLYNSNVTYVRNITDVDDKIIEASQNNKEDINEITNRVIKIFHENCKSLNCLKPTIEPKATEHVKEMIEMTSSLIKKGFAYENKNHVFFAVSKFKDYGKLSNKNLDELKAGSRIEISDLKKNPMDFVLWKPSNEKDPGWESPWGRGRPGWHLECSAMSEKYLGKNLDIHGGGLDLIFPHHENEIAQSCCNNNTKNFANYWVHNGFVTINNEKMSKSLGNIISITDATKKYSGQVVRLALLSAHYSQPLDWNNKLLENQRATIEKWYQLYEENNEEIPLKEIDMLLDDLNTPGFIAKIHELYANANKGDEKSKKFFNSACKLIGLFDLTKNEWEEFKKVDKDISEEFIEKKIKERLAAKQKGDYKLADKIRVELASKGVIIEDKKEQTTWKFK